MHQVAVVDVDLTVVDLTKKWWEWLQMKTGVIKPFPMGVANYNLPGYFEEELKEAAIDGLDFFRQDGIYDDAVPLPGAVSTLRRLSENGTEVVFVSVTMGYHGPSKRRFLKKHFPFLSGIVFTEQKQYTPAFIFIDDRHENINTARAPVRILMDTPFTQNVALKKPCHLMKGWDEIAQFMESHGLIQSENPPPKTTPFWSEVPYEC